MHLSPARLAKLFTDAPAKHLLALTESSAELLARHGIDRNPHRLTFFLALVGWQSAGLTELEEVPNHSAVRLTQLWPGHFPSVAAARPFARDPARLADLIGAGRMGNGPAGSGDGWRYRARGYLRIDGRDAYASVAELSRLDLLGEPDLASAPETALQAACGLWARNELNGVCDAGHFDAVARRLGGRGEDAIARRRWLDHVGRVLAEPEADGHAVELAIAA